MEIDLKRLRERREARRLAADARRRELAARGIVNIETHPRRGRERPQGPSAVLKFTRSTEDTNGE